LPATFGRRFWQLLRQSSRGLPRHAGRITTTTAMRMEGVQQVREAKAEYTSSRRGHITLVEYYGTAVYGAVRTVVWEGESVMASLSDLPATGRVANPRRLTTRYAGHALG